MKKIITVDDLDRVADPEAETLADETVLLVCGTERVELDLTTDHAKGLRELLAPYFAAGAPPPEAPAAASASPKAPPPPHGRQPTGYNAGMRRFADAKGIKYRTPGGSPYYSVQLKSAYAAFLAGGGDI